ncbi:glycerophosphoryl diester phosphodiesterase [Pedobacter cryoconitis]|uniref:glycerophosphodiester phosphodiesterase family protein n=1 Tax=Pedobacter cryoconitis TaxID=188932 RepID=UPI00160A37FD|nr:glycerophosphodiester phosphodiesterase family protein [Pedobacter cryoconitis]MBB6271556.1 glycerophosphoryl diester phosphodiesterase [Pedobacter cryoconitis]
MKYLFIIICCFSITAATAQQKPDVQAHRGGRGIMPENSIAAMLHAIDLGVRTLELDCVISKDEQVVVSHDLYMSADFMLKPDGSTISKEEEKTLLLYQMPYELIKSYDGGTKVNVSFPKQQKIKTVKPLLSVLIDSVETYVKLHKLKPVFYNIEIKSSADGDGTAHPVPEVFSELVMNVIKSKGIAKRVIIQSFDTRPLVVLHQTDPKQKLSYLVANKDNFAVNLSKLGFTPDTISPYYLMVNDTFVQEAHQLKVKVLPWTVNDEASLKKMAELKVDGIISDYPDLAVSLFGKYQK